MDNEVREILATNDFLDYYNTLSPQIRNKYDYVIQIMKSQKIVNAKFVKHLENTELYEMRVSIGTNEYRTILFTIDSKNFVESSKVILLNSFLKKSKKQYQAEIQKAQKLINEMEEQI